MPSNAAKARLLIVDDEKDNLEALRRLLRNHYDVSITTSPFEALKLVQKEAYSVIISDQRMPEMSGVEFFEKVKNVCPASTRILLTGYTDIDSVIGAINRGHIYRYVAKPWDPEDLRLTLRQASEAYQLKQELELKNAELQRAFDELQLLDRAKARFLSLISHELNTPLTVLTSFTGLLNERESSFPEDIRKAVSSLSGATDRLKEIVAEVLTYVKLESENRWAIKDFALSEEVASLKKSLEKEFKKSKVTLDVKGEKAAVVKADAEKLRIALAKLLRDAFVRSPAGSKVTAEIIIKGKTTGVSVSREGEPLSADAFKPLETASGEMHHHRNLGLGLAICKLIVEGHRGEVVLASSADGRTTTVTLLLHQPH